MRSSSQIIETQIPWIPQILQAQFPPPSIPLGLIPLIFVLMPACGGIGQPPCIPPSSDAHGANVAQDSGVSVGVDVPPDVEADSGASQSDAAATPSNDKPAGPDVSKPPVAGPAFYPAGRVHSPITEHVAKRLLQIRAKNSKLEEKVFMKVGASSTVSSKTLSCFAYSKVDLGKHQHLEATRQHFLAGNAAGKTPFNRKTLAAKSGHTAKWVISGSPSPLQAETDLLSPSLAFVHYGTNDMGMGSTYLSAMPGFYRSMMKLCHQLIGQGIVPMLTGISPRKDKKAANRWVATYNAVIRGMAQHFQVPFFDLHFATKDIPNQGMGGDGIHLNGYKGGSCVLTEAGLMYGYNVRNLVALQLLDRMRRTLLLGESAIDKEAAGPDGLGTVAAPLTIDQLPFTDTRSTLADGQDLIDVYPGCKSTADEGGREVIYRLVLQEPKAIRAVVLHDSGVDVDIHLLDKSATAAGCLQRNDRSVQGSLAPGTYHFAVDTFVKNGTPLGGEYLFAVLECDDDDTSCDTWID